MTQETQIVHFDQVKRELALATSIDEVKQIRDKAEALRQYVRQQGATLEIQNYAAEIKIRAERRAGDMLKEMVRQKPGEYQKLHDETFVPKPSLSDLGITPIQSHRWQLETELAEVTFDEWVTLIKSENEELTSKGLRQLILEQKRKLCADDNVNLPKDKEYHTIVIDPPWPMSKIIRDTVPTQDKMDYTPMTIEGIQAIDIPSITPKDGTHLYLWTTHKYLPTAFSILDDWDFKYIFTMVWHKSGGFQPFNLPQYNCEFVLFGRKEGLQFDTTTNFFTCFNGKRREHSRKPTEFYDIVRRVSPAPRADIFGRGTIKGFDSIGYEAGKFDAQ